MTSFRRSVAILMGVAIFFTGAIAPSAPTEEVVKHPARQTTLTLRGDSFLINGQITYGGRVYGGINVEGLLFNSRMVQGIFDDANPRTRAMWNYPDGPWDPQRNTREFVAAMPAWRAAGLLSFTINLQGGNPQGYGKDQPWINSAINPDGSLKADYMNRLEQILDRADALGMAPIVGIFYFGQEPALRDEQAVIRATEHLTDWILARGYSSVMIEIANECDNPAYHAILRPSRADELIRLVQQCSASRVGKSAGRLLVSTSFGGGVLPPDNVIAAADFVLLHGNGVKDPNRIRQMIQRVRQSPKYHDQPILFNEDDHYAFDQPDNNLIAALSQHASWGLFDYRMKGENFHDGYQSVPTDWSISSPRKQGFFSLVREITGPAAGKQ